MTTDTPVRNHRMDWPEEDATLEPQLVRAAIARETETWGSALLAVGGLQLVGGLVGVLDPIWGVILILVAAISYSFPSGAMLPVYGVLMGWAMLANLLSGKLGWAAFGLLQGFWAFCAFRDFSTLRRAAWRLGIGLEGEEEQTDRAAKVFPWAGCALTLTAWIAFLVLIMGAAIWYAVSQQTPSDQALGLGVLAITDLACLGLGLSLAALLARYRFAKVSVVATAGSALLLVAWLAAVVFGS